MSTPEGLVKAGIKKWLHLKGIWYFMPVSNGFGGHGIPDFICCYKGRFIGIEAKAPGKRNNTSELQKRAITGINESGGLAVVVDDVSQLDVFLSL